MWSKVPRPSPGNKGQRSGAAGDDTTEGKGREGA